MVLLAKQKNSKSKLWIKEFQKVSDVAFYLKVTRETIYQARKDGYKVKGWYVDIIQD